MIYGISAGASSLGNEDRFGYAANAAWVLDGATDISGVDFAGRTAAWWLVEAYQAELQDCAGDAAAMDAYRLAVHLAAGVTERLRRRFGADGGAKAAALEQASAALSLVRRRQDRWSVLALADCPVLYRDPSTNAVRIVANENFGLFEGRSLHALAAARLRRPGASLARLVDDVRPVLSENRASMNRDGGYAVAALRAPPANLLDEQLLPEGVTAFAILSDGFSRWYDLFGLGTPDELYARIEQGAAAQSLAELRDAERNDPDARRHLRFKVHDDATCLYVRTSEL
jgi:hypothetical protein